jgi:hypothetical protein
VESYRITSDIERIETSVTVAGRRVGVRVALLLLIGLLTSIGLVGLLAPALGSPILFFPIGLVPLYVASLIAFVRPGDGRPIEMQLLDRLRFARATKLAANLGRARLEPRSSVLDLTKEVVPVKDVRTGHEVQADLTELDMPFTVRGRSDLRLLIDGMRITVRREEGSDEIAVTVREA